MISVDNDAAFSWHPICSQIMVIETTKYPTVGLEKKIMIEPKKIPIWIGVVLLDGENDMHIYAI